MVPGRVLTLDGQRITTPATLEADLRASLAARGHDAGYTFGQFWDACMAAGATRETPLVSIEFGVARYGQRRIVVSFEADGMEVREVV